MIVFRTIVTTLVYVDVRLTRRFSYSWKLLNENSYFARYITHRLRLGLKIY